MAIDKNSLIDKLNTIEGLTNDERSALLGLLRSHKKYGLVWEDKPEDVEERLRSELPVLIEDKDKFIPSDNPDAPNHILIEGDNLEALTTLAYTHEGKIDVIYIDPPYNTGNTDRDGGFVYNDAFVGVDDDYRHSKWLSFMVRRLKLAKQLLSKNGLMFISIGDHEMSQLVNLCKEVFLEPNYIETYVWISTNRPDNSSPILRRNAEFVLCVARDAKSIKEFRGVVSATSGMPSLTKAKEKIKTIRFPENSVRTTLDDGVYEAGLKDNGRNPQWELMEDATVSQGIFTSPVVLRGHSYWATDKKVKEELDAGTEIWIKSASFVPYYLKTKESVNRPTKILPGDIVKDGLYANTELNSGIFHEKVFNNPKPSTLVQFLINFIPAKTILDFFAGSGTTLHATMQLNAEDGGNRKCILVTNNENGICENVTYERNKRVINGYTKPNGDEVEGLKNNSLRYYRTSFVGRSRTLKNMRQLMSFATDMLCIKEDLYTELDKFGELPTHPKVMRYFSKGDRSMLVIYYEAAIAEIVEQIEKLSPEKPIKVYVFSPSEDPWEEDFEFVNDKVELCALPAAIYNTYKRILPKKKDERVDIDVNAKEPEQPKGESTLFDLFEEGGEQ
jgi:adenine-specific DNA-methyltransferase